MPYVTAGKENSSNIELYYEDHGSGKPVVLIHGYPLSGASWEKQVPVLLHAGYRVITYDRRGFGKSSQPTTGYNYDTFAEDLHKLIISGVPPYLLKTADNPEGVDASVFAGIEKAVAADRYAFFTEFFKNFYNTDVFLGKRVSEQAVQANWNTAACASATASLACVATWHEDFREDLARIDVPTLVIHGDADRVLPITAAGLRTVKLIKGARQLVVKDGPHCITWTHAEEVNAALVSFFGAVVGEEISLHVASRDIGCGPTPKYYGHRRVEWRILLSWTAAKKALGEERRQLLVNRISELISTAFLERQMWRSWSVDGLSELDAGQSEHSPIAGSQIELA